MKYFSTFTGIGGFEVGIQNAYRVAVGGEQADPERVNEAGSGLEPETGQDTGAENGRTSERPTDIFNERPLCVGYSEIDKYATSVYERNFPDAINYGDITKINADELPDFDCLVGGFPCQAFSIAGKRRGFEDTRGTLFFDLARILRAKRPMYGVFENVKGLVSHDGGNTLDIILEQLQELGYYCNWEIYNSKDYGVPQNRERIILICRNIKGLTSIGQNSKMTSYESLIQEYLFQLLLNNLNEVKKLQETASKDWVLGYLIWKEITESQEYISANTSDGITTVTVENMYQLKAEALWQNIATWLSRELGVDCSQPNQSTISTALKKIIPSTTYTYSQMRQSIWLATVVLRKLQNNLWKLALSDLTVIQEGTKYARINNKTEEAIITESGTVHLPNINQGQDETFVKRHLRGTPRPQVFPFTGTSAAHIKVNGMLGGPTWSKRHDSIRRVYDPDGLAPTIPTGTGGGVMPKIKVPEATKKGYAEATVGQAINLAQPNSKTRRGRVGKGIANTITTQQEQYTVRPVITPDRLNKRQNGRRIKEDGEPAFTVTAQDKHGVLISKTVRAGGRNSPHGSKQNWDSYEVDGIIRRLTPLECERLQGFPDNWTKYGKDGEEISDTQRYKMCGNAVTTNVIQAVFERILA